MADHLTLEAFEAAARTLQGVAVRTPLVPLQAYDARRDVLVKPEMLQPTASFKIRGVYNAVAAFSAEERARGIATVSAGNTAQALGWVGRHFGVAARSVMPENAPLTKLETFRAYGGTPVLMPMDELFDWMRNRGWQQEPYAFVHPWTNPNVMVGHGTLALEIIADLPEVQTVYVPVGGGGLIGGVGSALKLLKPDVRVVAVEPEDCPALHTSFQQGKAAEVECHTLADGVHVPFITEENYPILREIVDEVMLVPESTLKAAIKRLALRERIVAEGAGALAVAAALSTPPEQRGRTVALVTGGNLDTATLTSILNDEEIIAL